ncbi:MAG: tRNA uridine-5-carboxymethylaminomethyl(34) synthesis GTPase MnmE [Candidatus Omnitrophota bacterium]
MAIRDLDQDTIVAVATAPGEGGIGVVRLSGRDAVAVADRIFESRKKIRVADQGSFTAQYGHIVSKSASGEREVIDEVLLLVMRAPRSYTCEDVVEISAHGGSAVLQAVLGLAVRAGARLAARGEFTKRAFLNGRLDLLQAEAVLDLVRAKTELGRRWAAAQLEGTLSRTVQGIKDALVSVLSHLEASIDFPDDFVEADPPEKMAEKLAEAAGCLSGLLSGSELGGIAKQGLRVVITGRPNVGKSSLMNCLARTNRVIVTPYPGTTRDVVEEEVEIRGFPVRVLDTAGIQDAAHPIEKEGIERSKLAVHRSDLVLYVLDGSGTWSLEDEALLRDLGDKNKIVVLNKSDLPGKLETAFLKQKMKGTPMVETSCILEGGIHALEEEIVRYISGGKALASEEPLVNTVRQKDLIEKALKSVGDARTACQAGLSAELIAVDVRLALDHLGALTGEVITDDILGDLFDQFCIGK